jgi:acetoacetate decarboxylase
MTLDLRGASGFSMPLGASLYPDPPHHFHGARQAFVTYEADVFDILSIVPHAD